MREHRGLFLGWGSDSVRQTLQKGVVLTVEQVLTAVLEQAAEVEWDEELGPQRIAVQVTGQCKRTLQNWD